MPSASEQFPATQSLLSAAQLEKLGVRIRNKYDLVLECLTCGEIGAPQPRPDGALPRGYWKCPNLCNG
ncbi:MAG TPA: hypothetical protein VJ732_08705 [Bryobacteraceae bacterium]|nr:hypothetical protein [Bryobacteraceae bacterium]